MGVEQLTSVLAEALHGRNCFPTGVEVPRAFRSSISFATDLHGKIILPLDRTSVKYEEWGGAVCLPFVQIVVDSLLGGERPSQSGDERFFGEDAREVVGRVNSDGVIFQRRGVMRPVAKWRESAKYGTEDVSGVHCGDGRDWRQLTRQIG